MGKRAVTDGSRGSVRRGDKDVLREWRRENERQGKRGGKKQSDEVRGDDGLTQKHGITGYTKAVGSDQGCFT